MHIAYWHLNENPFQNVTDTRFVYLGNQYREALARLLFLIEQRKSGGVITGPFGVGKSMVLELVRDHVQEGQLAEFLQVDGAGGGSGTLGRMLLRRLGYSNAVYDTPQILELLAEHFNRPQRSNHVILAVDEAHLMLDEKSAEFLHLLTNLRRRDAQGRTVGSAVTLILSGHPELMTKLAQDGALCQRLQLSWEILPLTEAQTMEYVNSRISVAGGDMWTFAEEVFPELHKATGGLPRLINNVCDVALVLGAAAQSKRIDLNVLREAVFESRATSLLDLTIKKE